MSIVATLNFHHSSLSSANRNKTRKKYTQQGKEKESEHTHTKQQSIYSEKKTHKKYVYINICIRTVLVERQQEEDE